MTRSGSGPFGPVINVNVTVAIPPNSSRDWESYE